MNASAFVERNKTCPDVKGTFGVLGTPAADSATGELYVSCQRQRSAVAACDSRKRGQRGQGAPALQGRRRLPTAGSAHPQPGALACAGWP